MRSDSCPGIARKPRTAIPVRRPNRELVTRDSRKAPRAAGVGDGRAAYLDGVSTATQMPSAAVGKPRFANASCVLSTRNLR